MAKNIIKARLTELHNISVKIHSINEITELLDYILTVVTQVVGADRASLFLVDRKKNELYSVIAQSVNIPEIRLKIGEGIAGKVVETGKIITIQNTNKSGDFHSKIDKKTGYKTRNMVCIPMIGRDHKAVAALQVLNKKDGDFDAEDEEVLLFFSSIAGIALENAFLYDRLTSSNKKLKKSQNSLKKRLREETLLFKLEKEIAQAQEVEQVWLSGHNAAIQLLNLSECAVIFEDLQNTRKHIVHKLNPTNCPTDLIWNLFFGQAKVECQKDNRRLTLALSKGGVYRGKEICKLPEYCKDYYFLPVSTEKTRGILVIGNRESESEYTTHELKLLEMVSLNIQSYLDNLSLLEQKQRAQLEKRSHETELRIAARIQEALLKDDFPPLNNSRVSAFSQPAKDVGGDYYDFISLGDEKFFFIVADVAGKGVQGSLIMTAFRAMVRAEIKHCHDLEKLAVSFNETLCNDLPSESFITVFMALFDGNTGHIQYVNGGHMPPIVLRDRECDELPQSNPLMGLIEGCEFIAGNGKLNPGETLICFTDGVSEAMNEHEELYEIDRLTDLLKSCGNCDPEILKERLLQDLTHFCGNAPANDDTTFFILKYR